VIRQQVIARYLEVEQNAFAQPTASFALTPENYKFRYMAKIDRGGNRFFVFAIKPRRRVKGLMEGHIWIEQETGTVVHQEGRLATRVSVFVRRIGIVRDSGSLIECPYARITRIVIETRLFGRATLTIRERQPISISSGEGFR
jgi:hypothetical protein